MNGWSRLAGIGVLLLGEAAVANTNIHATRAATPSAPQAPTAVAPADLGSLRVGKLADVSPQPDCRAAVEGDYVRTLINVMDVAPALAAEVAPKLAGRPMPAVLSGFVGR